MDNSRHGPRLDITPREKRSWAAKYRRGMSIREIAESAQPAPVSYSMVRYWLVTRDVPLRPQGTKFKPSKAKAAR